MSINPNMLMAASEGLLANAAIGASWEGGLEGIAEAAGSHSAALWRSNRHQPVFVGNRSFVEGMVRLGKPGGVPYTDDLMKVCPGDESFIVTEMPDVAEKLGRLDFYREAMVRVGFPIYASLTLKQGDDAETHLRFVLLRDSREGQYTQDDRMALDRTASNIRFAALFARRNAEFLVQSKAASYLERREPAYALDGAGRVAPLNEAAGRAGLPLMIKGRRLVAGSDGEMRRVDRVVGEAVGTKRRPGALVLAGPDGRRFQLLVMPLFGVAFDVFSTCRAIAALVEIGGPTKVDLDGFAARFLAEGFDLTPREIEVAMLGSGGMPSATIAVRLGMGEGTARNHMKAILRKIGIHSQTELASLVARYH